MASEIKLQTLPVIASATAYAIVFNDSGSVWQTTTSTFVAYAAANQANYAVTMTETPATSGFYVGDFPTGITTAGTYTVVAYKRLGGSPASTDTIIGEGQVIWDGTKETTAVSGTNLITLAYAKQYLKITATTYDALISDLIASASGEIQKYCKRYFGLATYTETYDVDQFSYSLLLNNMPITSVAQVVLNPNGSNPETISGSQYAYTTWGEIRMKPTGTGTPYFPEGFQTVTATYTAGFSSIPTDLQLACAMLVANAYYIAGVDATLASEKLGDYQYSRKQIIEDLLTSPAIRTLVDPYKRHTV